MRFGFPAHFYFLNLQIFDNPCNKLTNQAVAIAQMLGKIFIKLYA